MNKKKYELEKAEANADDEMNSLISKATKETAAVTNTNLNQIAKLLPSKILGGDFVQIDSQINMGQKSAGLEEALLSNMDDLGSIEIDSGEESPSATAAI